MKLIESGETVEITMTFRALLLATDKSVSLTKLTDIVIKDYGLKSIMVGDDDLQLHLLDMDVEVKKADYLI